MLFFFIEYIPSSTFSKLPPFVMKLNFSLTSESNETLILFTPYFLRFSEYFFNCVPLVVSNNSSISFFFFFADKNLMYSIISLRMSGSPPVILIFFIPSLIKDSEILFRLFNVNISFLS